MEIIDTYDIYKRLEIERIYSINYYGSCDYKIHLENQSIENV